MGRQDYDFVKHAPPHDQSDWVKILVKIKDSRTGEVITIDDDGIFDDETGDVSTFIWQEGNYACDCNRALFWDRAKGVDERDQGCGE